MPFEGTISACIYPSWEDRLPKVYLYGLKVDQRAARGRRYSWRAL